MGNRARLCNEAYERARKALEKGKVTDAIYSVKEMFDCVASSAILPMEDNDELWKTVEDYYANFRDGYVEAARKEILREAKGMTFVPLANHLVLADMPMETVADEFKKGWKELGEGERTKIIHILRSCKGNEKILFQNAFRDRIPYVLAFALEDDELMERLLWKKD